MTNFVDSDLGFWEFLFNIFDHLADSKMLFLIVSLLVLSFVVAETITEVSDII